MAHEVLRKAAKAGILGTVVPKEYGVEKILRDVKIGRIYIESNELLRAPAWRYR